MNNSEIGNFASQCWFEIPRHFPFVVLGAFVVMPNHVHGIVIINKNEMVIGDSGRIVVETQNFASLRSPHPNQFGPQSQNLASVIRGYKIGVTKMAREIEPAFQWQPRYHDHIVRNANEYKRIENYIINNPANWNNDKFYK
jgi:putative transposase